MVISIPGTYSQNYEKLNGPYGGGAKVYEGKNNVLYQVLYEHNGNLVLYKSINGGTSWSRTPQTPARIKQDPLEVGLDGNLYCAKNDKLYTSQNSAVTWANINSPATDVVISITALPNGTLLMSQSDQIFQSSNGGQNWNAVPLSGIKRFYFNSYTNKAYAISSSTLYVSSDLGLSWSIFANDDFGYFQTQFISTSNGFIFVSGLGHIWKWDTTGLLIKKTNLLPSQDNAVNIALAGSGRMFADENMTSFYSDNFGNSWTALPTNPLNSFYNFSTNSSGDVFAQRTTGSLYRSADNGQTWIFAANGINYATVRELDFINDRIIIALTEDGLFSSEDAGQSWQFIHRSVYTQSIFTETERIVLYGNSIYFSDNKDIYYFKDHKSQGVKIRTKTINTSTDKLYLNGKTGSMFSVESNRLFRTIDKGLSWVESTLTDVEDVYVFPDGSIIASRTDGIFRSEDNGDNWLRILSYNVSDNNRILGNGFSSVFMYFYNNGWKLRRSNDNGISWDIISIKDPNSLILEPSHGQACNNLSVLFSVGVTNEIFWSVDQGRTFSVFLDGVPSISDLSFSPNQKLYIHTAGNGLFRTFTSTSGTRILTGKLYLDQNKNCNQELNEAGIAGRIIQVANGNRTFYAITDGFGDFRIPVEQGDYIFEAASGNNTWKSCTASMNPATYNLSDTFKLGLQINHTCPFLKVDIQTSILRRCFENILYVDYANEGTQSASNSYVDVSLDPEFEYLSSSIPFSSRNGLIYRFDLGTLDVNQSGSFTIKIKVSCNAPLGQLHCAEAHIYPDSACVLTSQAVIRTSAECLGDSILIKIKNEGTLDMSSSKSWKVLDLSGSGNNLQPYDESTFFLNTGQSFGKMVSSRDRVLFIAEQDDSYALSKTSKTEILHCTANPLPGSAPLSISNLDEEEAFISKLCLRNRGSFDPNEITGYPIGLTDKKYVDNNQELEYVIRFQNTGTDTAFNIRIENTIPLKELDITTLNLGAFSHPYHFVLTPEGKLIFSFSHIMLPDSTIDEKASHGFVKYSIKPKMQLNNGSKILNDAFIYFDFNDAVHTNVDFHTIGIPIPVKVSESNPDAELFFEVMPNPVQEGDIIIKTTGELIQSYQLHCYDVNAKLLWTKQIHERLTRISRSELKSGMYLLVLSSKEGRVKQLAKLIIE